MASRKPVVRRSKRRTVQTRARAAAVSAAARLQPAVVELGRSAKRGREALRGLVRSTRTFGARNALLTEVRKAKDPSLRLEMVRAYVDVGRKPELVTSLALMTRRDAVPFFRDFFDAGGTTRDVAEWLGHVSHRYVAGKRRRGVDAELDGFWGDLWDDLVDAGKAIGEAIVTVVDAVIEAGKSFGEVLYDVVEYAQRRLHDVVEALLEAGKTVVDIVEGVIEKAAELLAQGADALKNTMKKVFKAIVSALEDVAGAVAEILGALVEKGLDYLLDGIDVLIRIGGRIKNILKAAWDLGREIFEDVIGFLVELGRSVAYILSWAAKQSLEILRTAIEKLVALGRPLAELVVWALERAEEIALAALECLLELGKTAVEIVVVLLTDPRALLPLGLRLLRQVGGTFRDFLSAAASLGAEALTRLVNALWSIGVALADILTWAVSKSAQILKEVVVWLLKAGVLAFDVILWAVDRGVQVLGWALEAIDGVLDSLIDILEWAVSLGPDWLDDFAGCLAEMARGAIEWFEDKIVLPILSVGKLVVLIALARANIVFLAVAFFALGSLVDDDKTDFRGWPATFAQFKQQLASKIAFLPAADATTRYVIVSDAHKESQADVDAGIGHFHKNKALFRQVLDAYADEGWTLVALGDDEEFWYSDDLDTAADPVDKVDEIVAANATVYEDISTGFYKNRSPRRFVKLRGNHDDVWREGAAVSKLEDHGFPGLAVPDFAVIRQGAREFLLMHGHQFDAYNCDANSYFGKFASNFVGESIDELNDILVGLFGSSARIEGWALAPFFKPSEWKTKITNEVADPKIVSGVMYDEQRAVDQGARYGCSMIIGHTHDPKLMRKRGTLDRCYVNAGTAGWWEGCVWTVEIDANDVFLKAWTSEGAQPYFSRKLETATAQF